MHQPAKRPRLRFSQSIARLKYCHYSTAMQLILWNLLKLWQRPDHDFQLSRCYVLDTLCRSLHAALSQAKPFQ